MHPDPTTDLAYTLPADAYCDLLETLRTTLPPPLDPTEDGLTRRDNAAIARIAALQPANSTEAELAGQFVIAAAQAKDCLRLAYDPNLTLAWSLKCRAQAARMMREAKSAVRELLRLQAARRKTEADPETCDRAARAEHITAVALAEAAATLPRVAPVPPAPPHRDTTPKVVTRSAKRDAAISPELSHSAPVSPHDPKTRKQQTETPTRLALIDKFLYGPRSLDAQLRAPGVNGAMLLQQMKNPEPAPEPAVE